MKKYLLIFAFACLAYTHAQAQTQDSTKKKDMDRLTWEIAYNALPLLNWNGGNGQSILFRKNVEKYPKGQLVVKHRAYRLKTTFIFWDSKPNYPNSRIYNGTTGGYGTSSPDETYFNLSISAGYEYQQLFNRWQFYYGSDLATNYSYNRQKDTNASPKEEVIKQISSYGVGLKPFLGFKYFISPRFSLSSETSLYVGTSYHKSTLDVTINGVQKTDLPEIKGVRIEAAFIYLSSIFVSFHF